LAALFIMTGVAERSASAQGAWVGEAGSLSAGLDYSFNSSPDVVANSDLKFEGEDITAHSVSLSAEYTPIESLAVDVTLPMTMLKFGGGADAPGDPHGEYDDGDSHTTLTDLRANVRYQVLRDIVALSPHLGFTLPVADYETQGFAGAGRHLKALHLGASVGKLFDPFAPNLFVQATYEFTLAEKFDQTNTESEGDVTKEIGQNRSDVSAQLGYFFLDGDLRINAGFNWRIYHDGIAYEDLGTAIPLTDARFLYHDALLDEEFMLLGGDVGYIITDRISVDATSRFFVAGSNTLNGIRLGLSLTFTIL
jgi:hypothetical protein